MPRTTDPELSDEATPRHGVAFEPLVRPTAWLHEHPDRIDVIHDAAKDVWLKAWPAQVEHYTIPLYLSDRGDPLSTDAACALIADALGQSATQDGNFLKLLRAVERAHGIGA